MNPVCRGCGKPMIWAKTSEGKLIPLDSKAPVYEVSRDLLGEATARRVEGVFVTHFATCPEASRFSNKNGGNNARSVD